MKIDAINFHTILSIDPDDQVGFIPGIQGWFKYLKIS